MLVSLDIHGVIDYNPKKFIELASEIKEDKGFVFVITGHPINNEVIKYLEDLGFSKEFYDDIFSIQDELDKQNIPVIGLDKYGRNHYNDQLWDSCKGKICEKLEIDVHIDDTFRYMKYFHSTSFGYYVNGEVRYYV